MFRRQPCHTLLLILQRYYFESESQLWLWRNSRYGGCCLSYKDTILKANHSSTHLSFPCEVLLLILQRYYFESESQRGSQLDNFHYCCCLSYKDTILKANHSSKQDKELDMKAVAYPTKILFWKRITAIKSDMPLEKRLLLILQRYYFESESQLLMCLISIGKAVAYPTKILFWKRITAL